MPEEPRFEEDYEPRQVAAARRALVDVMQVLAAYRDSIVLVGGWVPDLLLPEAKERHIGSIDVDLALDAKKLGDGRYAELLKLLLGTRRYRHGESGFQFVTDVDLGDGEKPIEVLVEFLAPQEIKFKKNRPKLLKEFRVLKADGCGAAFHGPIQTKIEGRMINGAENVVIIQVAALPDFLIMKAFALSGRDKPKDAYDICYCLENESGGMEAMAGNWPSSCWKTNAADHAIRQSSNTILARLKAPPPTETCLKAPTSTSRIATAAKCRTRTACAASRR